MSTSALTFPLFPNSVASNDIDFIRDEDPSAFQSLSFVGLVTWEMPGRSTGGLIQSGVYQFRMAFSDGSTVDIYADERFADTAAAEAEVAHFAHPLGSLPPFMRAEVGYVVLNIDTHAAFEEAGGGFFVVSTENMAIRRSNNDMAETFFHETTHLALDPVWESSPEWLAAQNADAGFVTDYAASLPDSEDLAESALFARTYLYHPERLSAEVRSALDMHMGARLAFFAEVFGAQMASGGIAPGVFGSAGADDLFATNRDDVITALAGDDSLAGRGGDDVLNGGAGDDILNGGTGTNTLIGGLGDDLYRVYSSADQVLECEGEGTDRVASAVDFTLGAGQEIEILTTNGGAGTADINLTGNRLAQTIIGNAGDNRLSDGGGLAPSGDILRGLEGNDFYVLRGGIVTVIEADGQGSDRVATAYSRTLDPGASIEVFTTTASQGTRDINLVGNEVTQRIYGNAGENDIFGNGGRDVIWGGAGADVFFFNQAPGFAHMTQIRDFTPGEDRIFLDTGNMGLSPITIPDFFHSSSSGQATESQHRILYAEETGYLFYDPDGNGAAGRTYFARLSPDLALSLDDFSVV